MRRERETATTANITEAMTVSSSDNPRMRRPIARVYQVIGTVALTVVSIFGCDSDGNAVDIRKNAVSSPSQAASTKEQSPHVRDRPAGSSPGVGRRLDEAGSVKRDHPAAGMERPEKWKKESRPTFADLSKADAYPPLESKEFSSLGELGMRETKFFVVTSPPQDFLRTYKAEEAGAKIVESDRVKSFSLPVREGLMLVTATEHSDGKSLITEVLLPKDMRSLNLDVLETLRDRAEQSK